MHKTEEVPEPRQQFDGSDNLVLHLTSQILAVQVRRQN